MNTRWNPDDFQKDKDNKEKIKWTFGFNSNRDKQEDPLGGEKEVREDFGKADGRKKTRKLRGKSMILLLLLVALIIVLLNSLYIVPEGYIAYVTQFGRIISHTTEPGLKMHVPFVHDVNYLTNKIMVYDVSPSEVLTADKKAMVVDSYALWKIEDVTRFMRTLGGNIDEMERRIDASVYSNIKNIMGRMMQSEIISDEESSRDNLNTQVTKYAGEELANYGVKVIRVEIRRFDLPTDNLSAVYKRMISERNQMAAAIKADGEYEAAKMRNETDKEYGILIGEAEAAARRLQGEAEAEYMAKLEELYGQTEQAEFYEFMLELDALKASLQGDKTVILGPDSVLGNMLRAKPVADAAEDVVQESNQKTNKE